jgi:hypothetical protein
VRTDEIRAAFTDRLGDRVVFAKEPPNDAGIFFGRNRLDLCVVVVHPAQLEAMSEALSSDTFSRFVAVLVRWATHVLEGLAVDMDVDQAMDASQEQLEPEALALLDFVFED